MLLLSCKNRFYWVGVAMKLIGKNQFYRAITHYFYLKNNHASFSTKKLVLKEA